MRASVATLVPVARRHGEAKSGTWVANRARDGSVLVYHGKSVLLRVWPDNSVHVLNRWSRTRADRDGVRGIVSSIGLELNDVKEP